MPNAHHQPVFQTKCLQQAQAFTSRVWAKHESTVPEADDFSSDISRSPLGGSHFCTVDCASPIDVVISCLARMVVGRLDVSNSVDCKIGRRTADEIADWLKRRVSQVIDLSELAKYAGLSIRSLERRFLQYFHRSPAAYLKELRLDATHAKLSQPACRMSVTEVALTFHFEHLGRFSTSYRQKFGEKPSATLNRTKQSQSDNPHIVRKATRK